jgi:hypothetical protein
MGFYIHDPEEYKILQKATAAYETILTTAQKRNSIMTHKDQADKRLTEEELAEVELELGRLRNFRQRLLTEEPAIKPDPNLLENPNKEIT